MRLGSKKPAPVESGRRVATASLVAGVALALLNVGAGVWSGSASVLAIGVELAGDVLASAVVLVGLLVASRPPDANHPYGHGRIETVAGLVVGLILVVSGAGVAWRSLADVRVVHAAPGSSAIAVLLVTIAARVVMSVLKFRAARRIGSRALHADAWNDTVDIFSAAAALLAVSLARVGGERFLAADHYGGFAVGLVVIVTGLRIARDATFDLADTMPDARKVDELRRVVLRVPGVMGVEKQFGRKTGLQYHVDLHVEVAPDLTVRESHRIAHDVQAAVIAELAWVAGVLVHIEPAREARAADVSAR
jgi:cation diffusion facilitator family transporter